MRRTLGLLVLLGVVLAACGEPAEPASIEGAWQLESGTLDGEPIPIVDGFPITLTIEGDTVGGIAACNGYGGSYTLVDGEVAISELASDRNGLFPRGDHGIGNRLSRSPHSGNDGDGHRRSSDHHRRGCRVGLQRAAPGPDLRI